MVAIYNPCYLGVHVCGIDEAAHDFVTIANYPARDQAQANEAFERAREECEAVSEDEGDYVVDLMCAGDCLDDFWISRQMLPRLAKSIAGV